MAKLSKIPIQEEFDVGHYVTPFTYRNCAYCYSWFRFRYDKAAETIQETAPVVGKATTDVVGNISDNTASVAKHATDVAGETTQKVTSTISNKITLSVIIALIITGIIIVILEISRKKKKKPEQEQNIITEEIQDNKSENLPQ
jgi:hypothetical protein